MVSMKKTEKKSEEKQEMLLNEESKYPYGLRIYLDDDTLEKLGISGTLPLGSKMTLNAVVEVVSASKREEKDGSSLSMDLQITDMELSENKSAAKRLYKG